MRVRIRESKPNWARVLFAYMFAGFVGIAVLYSWVNPLGGLFGWVASLALISRT